MSFLFPYEGGCCVFCTRASGILWHASPAAASVYSGLLCRAGLGQIRRIKGAGLQLPEEELAGEESDIAASNKGMASPGGSGSSLLGRFRGVLSSPSQPQDSRALLT